MERTWLETQTRFFLTPIAGRFGGRREDNLREDTVQLAEVLRPGLRGALFTTMKLDLTWLLEAFPFLTGVPCCFSMHDAHDHDVHPVAAQYPSLQVLRPTTALAKHPYGTNHGKVMVLRYDRFVRLVVSSANLIPEDYSQKTNSLWIQDCPTVRACPHPPAPATEEAQDFVAVLSDYLGALFTPQQIGGVFREHSFDHIRARLVSSVPGWHDDHSRYGSGRLQHLLTAVAVSPDAPLLLQASSLGALGEWLRGFARSLGADPDRAELQLVWPSADFVRRSNAGYMSGSALCARRAAFSDRVRPMLCHYRSPDGRFRADAPPHIKTFLRYNPKDPRQVYWMLSGSHNLSKAAWGQLVQPRGSPSKKLLIHSFEISVLLFPEAPSLQPPCRIPYLIPPPHYSPADLPWVQDQAHLELDRFGQSWPGL